MRAAPGTVSVDRDRPKSLIELKGANYWSVKGAGAGAAAGERRWLETKSDLGSRE